MNSYVVKKTTFGGSVQHEEFTNLRKARSEAWKWINWQKSQIRDRNGPVRDYGELNVKILKWNSDREQSEYIAIYN